MARLWARLKKKTSKKTKKNYNGLFIAACIAETAKTGKIPMSYEYPFIKS